MKQRHSKFTLFPAAIISYLFPHVGQFGSLRALKVLNSVLPPSHTRSFPFKVLPIPVRYFIVSSA